VACYMVNFTYAVFVYFDDRLLSGVEWCLSGVEWCLRSSTHATHRLRTLVATCIEFDGGIFEKLL